jgi:hypothetical protein
MLRTMADLRQGTAVLIVYRGSKSEQQRNTQRLPRLWWSRSRHFQLSQTRGKPTQADGNSFGWRYWRWILRKTLHFCIL